MEIGMLWYDDDAKRTLNEKVARAVEHYKTKYGLTPTVCFVNPGMLTGERLVEAAAGVQLRPARTVMVNHFWVGVGDTLSFRLAAKPQGGAAVTPEDGKSARGNGARGKNGSAAQPVQRAAR